MTTFEVAYWFAVVWTLGVGSLGCLLGVAIICVCRMAKGGE